MKKAVDLLHELLDSQSCIHPDLPPRIVFDSFGDFSLNIAVTVWWHHKVDGEFLDPDYGCFARWLHQTDMDILRIFDKEGLDFAFPTTTTYLAGDKSRVPEVKIISDKDK
jgi:MscS family membrane protein